jgi:hypothetical protein
MPYDDGEPLESTRRRQQMEFLLDALHGWLEAHINSHASGLPPQPMRALTEVGQARKKTELLPSPHPLSQMERGSPRPSGWDFHGNAYAAGGMFVHFWGEEGQRSSSRGPDPFLALGA